MLCAAQHVLCAAQHVQGAQRLSSAAAKGVPWCSCRFAAMCRRCWTAAVCIYNAGHLKGHLCCRKHTHADARVAHSTLKIKMVHMAYECQCLCIIVQLLCEFALLKCLLSHWHSIPVLLSCRCIAFLSVEAKCFVELLQQAALALLCVL